jgi:type VI secretion system secreted protein Hcp
MAVDYFLKIDGIAGEVQDPNFSAQIALTTFSLGGEQVTSIGTQATGHGAGKVTVHPLTVTKPVDKASIPFFKSLTLGTHAATATLSAVKAGANRKPYLKIDLKSVFVTSYVISAHDEIPVESVVLSFQEIKIEYFSQDAKGTVTSTGSAGWNQITNTGS